MASQAMNLPWIQLRCRFSTAHKGFLRDDSRFLSLIDRERPCFEEDFIEQESAADGNPGRLLSELAGVRKKVPVFERWDVNPVSRSLMIQMDAP
jgi:hypothetical protein